MRYFTCCVLSAAHGRAIMCRTPKRAQHATKLNHVLGLMPLLACGVQNRVEAIRAALNSTSVADRERERERVRSKHKEQKRSRKQCDLDSAAVQLTDGLTGTVSHRGPDATL